MKRFYLLIFCFIGLLAVPSHAQAGEQGHYYPGVMGIRDYTVAPKGVYFYMVNPYYAAREYKDGSGDKLDHISVAAGRSVTRSLGPLSHDLTISAAANVEADVDVKMDTVLQQPTLLLSPGWEFLGAKYQASIAAPIGYMRINVKADVNAAATLSVGGHSQTITANRQIEVEDSKYGFGDLMVTPVMLDWRGKHYDVTSAYTFIAPTGAYDEGDIANIGMGFWSNFFQQALYIYPFDVPSTAVMLMGTYEINSYKYDKDVRPGQTVTAEYGLSQYLHPRVEVGVNGYHQWQVTEDSGSQGGNTSVKDSMNGIGSELTMWLMKGKLALVGRFNVEYGVRDRFEGYMSSVNILWAFGDELRKEMTKGQ